MKWILYLVLMMYTTVGYCGDRPISEKQWTDKAKVWTARSCVGESGFYNSDECVAIAWVYAKRAKLMYWPYLKMVRRYSAAIKFHMDHDRPWLRGLNIDGKRPENWPKNLRWKRYKTAWLDILRVLDLWATGGIADIMPEANHYGSRHDARVRRVRWSRIIAPDDFKNWFFNSRKVQ